MISEAAVGETNPDRPITVSAYRSLQAFVSAVKQGCSQVDEVTSGTDISLRLLSFLEETQSRTWSKMKATLSTYVNVLFTFSVTGLDLLSVVPCLLPQKICTGPCQLIIPPLAWSKGKLLRLHSVVCLTFKKCEYRSHRMIPFA